MSRLDTPRLYSLIWLGFKLAKAGDPFWIGWTQFRSWGMWKAKR